MRGGKGASESRERSKDSVEEQDWLEVVLYNLCYCACDVSGF